MCGIFGEILYNSRVDLDTSLQRLNLMTHRGPDGFGFEYGDYTRGVHTLVYNRGLRDVHTSNMNGMNYFSGHRRLSIIDLSENAFQPMESIDKRFSIIFNGEVYNYIELKKELVKEDCEFKTDHSDTEVLLNAYAKWGSKCLEKLRGMFAFAILDRMKQTVFMARDRIGQKPLYYEMSEERFAFASDLRPLLKYTNRQRRINHEALCNYMVFGYVPCPLSIFEGIVKLPPASYALVDLNSRDIHVESYWDINFTEDNNKSSDEFVNVVEECLTTSVAYRLRADVPVGAFISGGIDSTLVVKKIKEVGKAKFDIYGADFPQPEVSEKQYIEQVATRYGQRLNLSNIDINHMDNIKDIINVFDEPFDGGSSIALFDLFKEASEKYKVILTGDGGDELFAGYTTYTEFLPKQNTFSTLKKLYLPAKVLSFMSACGINNRKLNRLAMFINGDFVTNFIQSNYNLALVNLIKSRYRVDIEEFTLFNDIRSKIKEYKLSTLKAMQYLGIKTVLPGRMLYKLDRFSMRYSVEARSPFLDHDLARLAFTIPEKYTIDKDKTKVIPKKILENDFSMEFVHRKKQGFGSPLSFWFRESEPEKMFGILLDKKSEIYNYVDYKSLQEYFPGIENGYKGSDEKALWRMIVLAQYLENYKENIER
jgi:asparagine synthase (glutamine-hydrolysing)